MDFMTQVGSGIGALAATWTIAQKLGGFIRARKLAGQALEWIVYAKTNLIALNDLVFEIEKALADDKVSKEEVQVLMAKLAALSRTLRNRQVLTDAQLKLSSMAPKVGK